MMYCSKQSSDVVSSSGLQNICSAPRNTSTLHITSTSLPYKTNVTLHHEMGRNEADGHFHILYFLKANSIYMLFTMMKTIFKSED